MLLNVHVKNMALIKELDISFGEGLNVITGETGAGKSLLLGSVDLALGGKFSKDMLRNGEDSALSELLFEDKNQYAEEKLAEIGCEDADGEILISRKITDGRANARINGQTCTASMLKGITECLINVHGQRDNQQLLKPERQLRLLDVYGKKQIGPLLEDVSNAYAQYKACEKALEAYSLDEEKRLREISMLEYEINEIEDTALKDGEEEELEKQYRLINNSKKIIETLNEVHALVGYDSGAGELVGRAVGEADSLSDFDDELKSIASALTDAEAVLSDVNMQISSYLDEFTFSEQEFEEVRERLDTIRGVQAKYGSTVDKVNEYLKNSRERLEFLQNYETEKKKAEENYATAENILEEKCTLLSEKRQTVSKELSKELCAQLEELNFKQAVIEARFTRATAYRSDGFDDMELYISTNPGEPVKPLAKTASGGELSRIMLAVKNIIADEENTETLIFDEIDSGISGRTAQKVSEKMASIASNRQILCVTHLAQIAAMADRHFVIEKSADDNETVTCVRQLNREEQIEELARILGGAKITDAVMANAREMKESADEYKKKVRKK